mmetsp:Transcript_74552/g.112331  ORF Transcript_74552/g.112331 Transcript_74552/m.112331 type:complete len:179 (-) Transcript_74552:222-758(-)
MGRYCSDCEDWCSNRSFSRNQWLKGDGYSRCKDCVHPPPPPAPPTFQCGQCYREFNSHNNLQMHMQVHRPRTVACPVCGDTRFKSGANAVQHVESGYCTGCRGTSNARAQIYQYASQKAAMSRYINGTPLLTNGSYNDPGGVPDFPYQCPECARSFRQLSQLLQHQDQKHSRHLALGY